MLGCLQELQESYERLGSQLLIIHGEPAKAISQIASALEAKAVFWNLDVEPYAKKRDRSKIFFLRKATKEKQWY